MPNQYLERKRILSKNVAGSFHKNRNGTLTTMFKGGLARKKQMKRVRSGENVFCMGYVGLLYLVQRMSELRGENKLE